MYIGDGFEIWLTNYFSLIIASMEGALCGVIFFSLAFPIFLATLGYSSNMDPSFNIATHIDNG